MTETEMSLFTDPPAAGETAARHGILPFQAINAMRRDHEIRGLPEIRADQVQPASLDLRLGHLAYRVRASFLPGPDATVLDKIRQLDGYEIDITDGAVLEKGCVYVVPLMESLQLKSAVTGLCNPKSSTGRLDVLTRVITDRGRAFDQVERGYEGPLYAEIAPRTFSIVVRPGTRLSQIRFRRGSPALATTELQRLHDEGQLILAPGHRQHLREKLVAVTIDLEGPPDPGAPHDTIGLGEAPGPRDRPLIGFRAKKHTDRIDVDKIGFYDPLEFWEPIHRHREPAMVLNPDDFYILATREAVRVPPDYAAEMVAYDTTVGEFRVHYAGFFDPGFGWDTSTGGSRAVLEVRSHEVPFMLEHGQTVGFLRYEKMASRPDRLYGAAIGSNYQNQGLALAKQFRTVPGL